MQKNFNKGEEYLIPEQNIAESQNTSIFFNPILPQIILDYDRTKSKENIINNDLLDENCNHQNYLNFINDIPSPNQNNIAKTKSSQNLKFKSYEISNLTLPSSNYFQNSKPLQVLEDRQPLGLL